MSLEDLAVLVNSEISQRSSYGERREVAEAPGHIMVWSNGRGRWFVGPKRIKRGEDLTLDANMVFVPGVTIRDLNYLIDNDLVDSLPLYSYSAERTIR